jgi:hypothetical protein
LDHPDLGRERLEALASRSRGSLRMRHQSSSLAVGSPRPERATSRATFLKRVGALTALAAGGLAAAPNLSRSASSLGRDVEILNYVLRLESMKAAFYSRAAAGGALSGELEQLAKILARHEQAHVAFLRSRLGALARPERIYDFGEATADETVFGDTARKLEEAAVAAYIGEGPNLSPSLMIPFAQMCSVEARHAAWVADVIDDDPAPRAADRAKGPSEVLAFLNGTGFEAPNS